jgi:adenylate kinase
LNYEVAASLIQALLGGRRTCEKCKAAFHRMERPPKITGGCDPCDGNLFQREDDRPASIEVRLEACD